MWRVPSFKMRLVCAATRPMWREIRTEDFYITKNQFSENIFCRCIFINRYIASMNAPSTATSPVWGSKASFPKNFSQRGAQNTERPLDTSCRGKWLASEAESPLHPQAMSQEETESRGKRAVKTRFFDPYETEAIKRMGESAKAAYLQYAKCWYTHNHIDTNPNLDTELNNILLKCLGFLNSLLHDVSYFRFRHTAYYLGQNKDIAVGKVVFLYDKSIGRSGKGKEVDISFEVCDEEYKFSGEKREERHGKVLKAFLEGDPKASAEDGHFKNKNSAAHFLHVLHFLTSYMMHDSIAVVKKEYRDVNDRLCLEQNNSNCRLLMKKNEMYIEIPKYEQSISNDEDNDRMNWPAFKEPFPEILSQLIKFVTEIVWTILGNMTSESKDKQLIDNLFGKERVNFDERYLRVDDKRIEWEDYMRAIKISQGEFSHVGFSRAQKESNTW